MTSIMSTVVAQLIGQTPLLLVYVIGMVVALSYWSRYRGPSMLTLIATASLLAVSIGQTLLAQYFIQSSAAGAPADPQRIGLMLSGIALTSSLIRAAAMGLLLAAVFMGRAATASGAVALVLVLAGTMSARAGAQGIQYDKIEIKTDKVAPNLYMLSGSEGVDPGHPDGAGGRIGVLAGPDGIFTGTTSFPTAT